jgi:hypothetical protein
MSRRAEHRESTRWSRSVLIRDLVADQAGTPGPAAPIPQHASRLALEVRWYPRDSLSLREVEELLLERGPEADHIAHLKQFRVAIIWIRGEITELS